MSREHKRVIWVSICVYIFVIGFHLIGVSDKNDNKKSAAESSSIAKDVSSSSKPAKESKQDKIDDNTSKILSTAKFDEEQGKQNYQNFKIDDYKNNANVGKSILIPSAMVSLGSSSNSALNVVIDANDDNSTDKMDGQDMQGYTTDATNALRSVKDDDNSVFELKAIIMGSHSSGIMGTDGPQPSIQIVGYQKVGVDNRP